MFFVEDNRKSKITAEHVQEASRLLTLWNASTTRRKQADFGAHYDLGNQANVGHYLHGRSALNPKAALAFAMELNCDVKEFSPRVAKLIATLGDQLAAAEAVSVGALTTVSKRQDVETLRVQLLENAGDMGDGQHILHDDVIAGEISLDLSWVGRRISPSHYERLRFIHAYGDSMSPTFEDGDILLVDTGRIDPSGADGVYVLATDRRVFIKRVTERLNGGHEVTSDNQKVKTVDVLDGKNQIRVLGKVVWCWNGKKL